MCLKAHPLSSFTLSFILILTQITKHSVATTVVSPFSSRPIPIHLIRQWTGDQTSPASQLLYELSSNGTLYTPNHSIPILNIALPLPFDSNTSFSLNGAETNPAYASIQVRKGAGYTVLFNVHTHQIVRLWGNNLHLSLPDPQLYPFILVDTPVAILRDLQASLSSSVRPQIPAHLNLLRQSRPCSFDVDHHVELLIAYDNTFCTQNGNDQSVANAFVQAMINQADQVYRDATCVRLTLSHIDAHCNDPDDPYTLTRLTRRAPRFVRNDNRNNEADFVLFGFRDYWESNSARRNVHRDAAYLFTNYVPNSRTVGIAFNSAVCTSSHYGWVQDGSLSTFVHETGHTLSASHSSSGIMTSFALPGAPLTFSRTSINEINTFVDDFRNRGVFGDTSCIRPRPAPICDPSVCPGRCIRNQCIVSFTLDAAARGFIPCTPVRSPFFCVRQVRFNQPSRLLSFGAECPSNFEFLRLPTQGPSALCCNRPSETISSDLILKDNIFFNDFFFTNGRQEVVFNVIDDTSLIARDQTLMRTTIDSTCGLGTTGDFPLGSPTPTASPSATPTGARRSTCSALLSARETFRCRRRNLGTTLSSPRGYRVRFSYEQRNGNFSALARVGRSIGIRIIASAFSTERVAARDLGEAQSLISSRGTHMAVVGVDALSLEARAGVPTCCGARLFMALSVEVCNSRGALCDTVEFEGSETISCLTCRGNLVASQLSQFRPCPKCVRP